MSSIRNLQIGDMVSKTGGFGGSGVVVEKGDDGTVVVDSEPMTVSQYHRHTNTSGLTPEEKEEFNFILDQIYSSDSRTERLAGIAGEISRLKERNGNQNIIRYLRNQQAYLMRNSRG